MCNTLAFHKSRSNQPALLPGNHTHILIVIYNHVLQDSDENKLVYTELFERYCTLLESNLDAALSAAVPGFDMGGFIGMVEERQDELASEVG